LTVSSLFSPGKSYSLPFFLFGSFPSFPPGHKRGLPLSGTPFFRLSHSRWLLLVKRVVLPTVPARPPFLFPSPLPPTPLRPMVRGVIPHGSYRLFSPSLICLFLLLFIHSHLHFLPLDLSANSSSVHPPWPGSVSSLMFLMGAILFDPLFATSTKVFFSYRRELFLFLGTCGVLPSLVVPLS